jgi:hypothetical protein
VVAVWEEDDPYGLLFAATFGDLSAGEPLADRIRRGVASATGAIEAAARHIAAAIDDYVTPLDMGVAGLEVSPPRRFEDVAGVFVGSARSLLDIRAYWNLRSVAEDALFWDRSSPEGGPFAGAIADRISAAAYVPQDARGSDFFPCYVRAPDRSLVQLPTKLLELLENRFHPMMYGFAYDLAETWQVGLRYLPTLSQRTVIAHSEDVGPSISKVVIPLPPTALASDDIRTRQELVVSVNSYVDTGYRGTLKLPFLLDLNDWYRFHIAASLNAVRVEEEGFGVIDDLLGPTVDLFTLDPRSLLAKLFERAGINARRSLPGEAASHLITQFGGYGGLRTLRLPGVRELLSSSAARRGIRRNAARQMIRRGTDFDAAEPLFVGGRRLLVDDVWNFLLDRRIFLPGLELKCPWCQHASFFPTRDLGDEITCPKCGRAFLLGPALAGDPVRFRLSGLLEDRPHASNAGSDAQPAAIPVLLALLYLQDWASGSDGLILETSHELSGDTIGPCETDIIAISYGNSPRPYTHVLIGECKGRGVVDANDVDKLMRACEVIRASGVHCDLLFSTTRGEFGPDEIELFRSCYEQSSEHERLRRSPVLLTRRDLESSRFGGGRTSDDRPDRIPGAWSGFGELVEWSTRRYFSSPGGVRITPTG